MLAALALGALLASSCKRPPDKEPTWRGIDAERTCRVAVSGGERVDDRRVCVSHGRTYLCLYNDELDMFDCAPSPAPASEEPWQQTKRP